MSQYADGYRAGLEAAARWHEQDAAALRVTAARTQRHRREHVERLAELHETAAGVFRAGALGCDGLVSAFNGLTPEQIRLLMGGEPKQDTPGQRFVRETFRSVGGSQPSEASIRSAGEKVDRSLPGIAHE